MDLFKQQFEKIRQQLSALSASQKMLTFALVAIMVMTLFWWAKYAGQPEMEPLLTQSFGDDDLARVTQILDVRGEKYDVTGDKKVLVPAEHKIKLLAALGFAQVLPKNTVNGFDEIIKQLSPWDGQNRQDMMFNRGKEMTLGRVIGEYPDVASATVVIDPKYERHIDGNTEPTAFVSITMKTGAKAGKQLVNAAAKAVSGAQGRLSVKNVQVVIDGVPQHVRDESQDGPGDAESIYSLRQQEESRLTRKVADQLAEIQGVLVAVTVNVENKTIARRKNTVDDIKTKEIKTENNSKETTGPTPPPADPGAGPNVGTNGATIIPGGGSGGGANHNETMERSELAAFPSTTTEETKIPAGEATPVGASVRVPRSYFVRIAKGDGTAEPDDAAVKAKIKEEQTRIRETVLRCTGIKSLADVAVEPYFDQMPVVTAAPAPSTASAVTLAMGGHFKEIALGALALVSLFMVSTIVKKSSPPPAVVRVAEPKGPAPMLEGGEQIAGEAGEGSTTLDGMELDEDAIKTQQMLEQVSTMVEENPDAAATLVKRWLNRS